MTRKEIEKTNWARDFKKDSPISYEEAIDIAMIPKLSVTIYRTNENGEWMWAIEPVNVAGFWMDARKTKKESEKLCKEMGWRYDQKRT
jgi:hypothetical protein